DRSYHLAAGEEIDRLAVARREGAGVVLLDVDEEIDGLRQIVHSDARRRLGAGDDGRPGGDETGCIVDHGNLALVFVLQRVLPRRGALDGSGIVDHGQRAPGEGHGIERAIPGDRVDVEEFGENVPDSRQPAFVDGLDQIGRHEDGYVAVVDGDEIYLPRPAGLQLGDDLLVRVDVGGSQRDAVVGEERPELQRLVVALPTKPSDRRIGPRPRQAERHRACGRGGTQYELSAIDCNGHVILPFVDAAPRHAAISDIWARLLPALEPSNNETTPIRRSARTISKRRSPALTSFR